MTNRIKKAKAEQGYSANEKVCRNCENCIAELKPATGKYPAKVGRRRCSIGDFEVKAHGSCMLFKNSTE